MQLFWNVGRSVYWLATNKDVILKPSKSGELEILIWWIYTVLILLNQEAINALCRKATIKTAGGKTGDS